MTHRQCSCLVVLVLLAAAALSAAEKKIQANDLPPAVQKAVQRETRGATIKGYAKETEGGKTTYEVETLVNGHSRDVVFDPTGKLVAVEEAIPVDTAPAAVKTAFEKLGQLLSVETITKGTTVTYEGVVQKNGKKAEIVVDAAGRPAKP